MSESSNREQIDRLLEAIRDGDETAMDALMPLVEGELRRLARSKLKFQRRDQTLRTTAMVNEAYAKMVSSPWQDWKNRAYFFGAAARTMRNILVDYTRERSARKRGGGWVRVELEGSVKTKERWLIKLDQVLYDLEKENETWARIVELHFFGGLTFEEIAEVLNTTLDTVKYQWKLAKAWLKREMEE